jgi:hypothetical protein
MTERINPFAGQQGAPRGGRQVEQARRRMVARLIADGAAPEDAHQAVYGVSKDAVDTARTTGALTVSPVPKPPTSPRAKAMVDLSDIPGLDPGRMADELAPATAREVEPILDEAEWRRDYYDTYYRLRNVAAATEHVREAFAWGYGHAALEAQKGLSKVKDIAGALIPDALAILGGYGYGFIGPQQALFEMLTSGNTERAYKRFNPTWVQADDPETQADKTWQQLFTASVGQTLVGLLTGNLLMLAGGRVAHEELKEAALEYTMGGDMLWGGDVREAWTAGYLPEWLQKFREFTPLGNMSAERIREELQLDPTDWLYHMYEDPKRFPDDPEGYAAAWEEIRNYNAQLYAGAIDAVGPWPLAGLAIADAGMDVFVDPLYAVAGIPKHAYKAARALIPALGASRILGSIAHRTGNPADVAAYLTRARKAAAGAAEKYRADPTDNNLRRKMQAEALVVDAESQTQTLTKTGPHDRVVFDGAERAAKDAAKGKKGKKGKEQVEHGPAHVNEDALELTPVVRRDRLLSDPQPLKTAKEAAALNAAADAATARKPKYADVVAVLEGTDWATYAPNRKQAILSAVRRNITAGAREGAPEEALRTWESTYEVLRNTDPDNVPHAISRIVGTEGGEVLHPELLKNIAYIDNFGNTIYQTVDVSEAGTWAIKSFGPDDMEWNSHAVSALIAGVPIERIPVRDLSLATYQAASTMRLNGVLGTGAIDVTALNAANREFARKANKAVKRRVRSLESRTKGYELNKDGKLVRTGQVARQKIDPSLQFMDKGKRAELIDGLKELAVLKKDGIRKATQFDWDAAGMKPGTEPYNPANRKAIPADYDRGLGERMLDGFAQGLWPETWVPTTKTYLRNSLWIPREPMRALSAVSPKIWRRIRDTLVARDYERERVVHIARDILEESGAFKVRKNGTLKLADEATNNKLFDVLDTPEWIIDGLTGNEIINPSYINMMDGLTEAQRNAVRRTRQLLDYYADKQGIPRHDRYITGYISHVFAGDEGMAALQALGREDPSLHLTIRHLLDRKNKLADEDLNRNLAQILDIYAAGMSRKLHMEPLYQDIDGMARQLAKQNNDPWIRGEVGRVTRILKHEPSMGSQMVDNMLVHLNGIINNVNRLPGVNLRTYKPGDAGRSLLLLTNMVYSSLLAGNPRYMPMQLWQGFATTSADYGIHGVLGGAATMATPEGQHLARLVGIDKQWKQIREDVGWKKILDVASDWHLGTPSINMSEFYIRGVTMSAAIDDMSHKLGYRSFAEAAAAGRGNEILHYGIRAAEETNHMFGIMGKPTKFTRLSKSGTVAATQFLSFIPKQTEQLLATSLKNPGNFFEYMVVSGVIQRVCVKDLGIDMSQYLGLGYLPGPDLRHELESASLGVLNDVVSWASSLPAALGGDLDPVAAVQLADNMAQSLNNMGPVAVGFAARHKGIVALVNATDPDPENYVRKLDGDGAHVRDYDFDIRSPGQEIVSAITGFPSIRDNIDREVRGRHRQLDREKAFYAYKLAQAYKSAEGRGDYQRMMAIYSELASSDDVPPLMLPRRGLRDIVRRNAAVYALEARLRGWMQDTDLTVDKMRDAAQANKLRRYLDKED